MAVLVPIIEGIIQGLGQLIQVLKTTSFQGQGTQLLPPRFNLILASKRIWGYKSYLFKD